MAKPYSRTRTVLEPLSHSDLPGHNHARSLALSTVSDSQTLIYLGTQSGALILLSADPRVSDDASDRGLSVVRSVAVSDSPVEAVQVFGEIGRVLVLSGGFLFLGDLLLSQPLKRLSFLKGASVFARRRLRSGGEGESSNLAENAGDSAAESSNGGSHGFLKKLGGGIRTNGLKIKEPERNSEGIHVFAVVVGKRLILIEIVLSTGPRVGRNELDFDGSNVSYVILKEIQCIDGIVSMVWLNDSIIVGTANGYSLISCVTGQSGVIFSLPDVSTPPLPKLLSRDWNVLLLVDNVGVIVNEHGQPVSGSIIFSRRPDWIAEISLYVVVVRDGKMELYHKKSGSCIQTVSFGGEAIGGPCIVADEEDLNGKLLVVATPSKVICYRKLPPEEQIKDLLRKKDFKEAISLVEELECEGEITKDVLSFVHAQVGFLLLFGLQFEEAVNHFLQSETMQPSELFPFIMRDPNRWSLLVPRNRYWGLHPPPAPLEDVVDEGLMAIQRALFLRKAGVETPVDDNFLLNPPSRADLLESAINSIIRYLEVSRDKELTEPVKEGVDTLLMYVYRALNRVDEMEKLASSANSCIVRPLSGACLKGDCATYMGSAGGVGDSIR